MRPGFLPAAALALAATAAAQTAPPAETATTLTLQQAFARALSDNLALGRAQAEVNVAQAQKRAALSLILPRLTASGAFTRNTDEVDFGADEDRRVILPLNDYGLRLTLAQPIFAGLREKRTYDQAKQGIGSAQEGARAAADAVLLQVATDYLGMVQGDLLLGVEEKSLELARKRRKQAQDLLDAGEATRVDVLRAETAIKEAERRVVAARQLRVQAQGRLRVDLALDGDLAVVEPQAVVPPPPDHAILVEKAAAERPEIRQARHALEVARLEVQKQKGAYLPVLTADAGYIRQRTTFPKDAYGFARLNVTLPIFQGGEVGARVSVARERERQARMSLEESQRQVAEEVQTALLDLQAATTNLALAEEQRAAAEAEYEQVFDLYRSQEATSLDVDSSETALADARRAATNSRLLRKLAEVRVWFAAGSLQAVVQQEVIP